VSATREVLSTGIDSLDVVLGGGLPRRQSLVVTGNPGTGKTILCAQMAFAQARAGRRTVVATITSEPNDKLIEGLKAFDFFDEALVGEEVFLVSAYPWLKKGAKEARELLLGLMQGRRADTLYVDGLRALRDLWQDEARLREFMYDMTVGLAAAGCTGVFSTEYGLDRLIALPEATTVDGIVSLTVESRGARRVRRLEVVKLRGQRHLTGEHCFRIDRAGVRVYPRLETSVVADPDYTPTEGRAAFGLPNLDGLLRGGLPRESSTLIIGSTGIGKTLLSLHFAAEGARVGEPCLFVSFFETRESLVGRAARVGLDLRPAIASGGVVIDYTPPLDLEADVLAAEVLAKLAVMQAKRLVIDGAGEVERALGGPGRTREFLAALMISLRQLRVTSIQTKELTKLSGEVDLEETPVSLIAENLLFARHVEMRGELRRILSILKMRASGFDPGLREFELGEAGLRVLSPLRGVGVFQGLVHLPNDVGDGGVPEPRAGVGP
jgi:circadian clock protein KaiC